MAQREDRSVSMTQLDPLIPLDTPKGPGMAHLVIDYGFEHHLGLGRVHRPDRRVLDVLESAGADAGERDDEAEMTEDGITLMKASDWAKCLDPKGSSADLIAVIENSDWLRNSSEQITFMECIQRAKDLQGWLKR